MAGHIELIEKPSWDLYYLIDLRYKTIIGKYDGEEEVVDAIADIYSTDKAKYNNLEVVKALGWKEVVHDSNGMIA